VHGVAVLEHGPVGALLRVERRAPLRCRLLGKLLRIHRTRVDRADAELGQGTLSAGRVEPVLVIAGRVAELVEQPVLRQALDGLALQRFQP
jgi:hypothetical protein